MAASGLLAANYVNTRCSFITLDALFLGTSLHAQLLQQHKFNSCHTMAMLHPTQPNRTQSIGV